MGKRKDWLPSKRSEQLAMAKSWHEYILVKGPNAWKIVNTDFEAFVAAYQNAESEYDRKPSDRNPSTNVLLKEAFKKTEVLMRDMKKRYFLTPPLNDSDLVALGLRPKDNTPTPVGTPVGLVTATVKYVNEGALELNIRHVEGSPFDDRANYGCKIAYDVFPADAPAVTEVEQLRQSRFVRRKRESFIFDKKDSRKVVYFCLRYENSKGQTGQWGQIISAMIP